MPRRPPEQIPVSLFELNNEQFQKKGNNKKWIIIDLEICHTETFSDQTLLETASIDKQEWLKVGGIIVALEHSTEVAFAPLF